MPQQLNWSPGELAALRNKGQREEMTHLLNAYFRVAGKEALVGIGFDTHDGKKSAFNRFGNVRIIFFPR
jgi:hypothetical protein